MAVSFQNGPEELSEVTRMTVNGNRVSIVGSRIRDVFASTQIASFLNLQGDETVSVRNGGRSGNVDSNYVIKDGDYVSFSKATGEKGV